MIMNTNRLWVGKDDFDLVRAEAAAAAANDPPGACCWKQTLTSHKSITIQTNSTEEKKGTG